MLTSHAYKTGRWRNKQHPLRQRNREALHAEIKPLHQRLSCFCVLVLCVRGDSFAILCVLPAGALCLGCVRWCICPIECRSSHSVQISTLREVSSGCSIERILAYTKSQTQRWENTANICRRNTQYQLRQENGRHFNADPIIRVGRILELVLCAVKHSYRLFLLCLWRNAPSSKFRSHTVLTDGVYGVRCCRCSGPSSSSTSSSGSRYGSLRLSSMTLCAPVAADPLRRLVGCSPPSSTVSCCVWIK